MSRSERMKAQPTLTYRPGAPPVFDPSPPYPAKQHANRSLPGQMWNHLASMFSSQQPLYWVNPHLVFDCSQVPLGQYQHQHMPCPSVESGGGLWHPAPPGGLQQQIQMYTQDIMQPFPQKVTHPSVSRPCKMPAKSLNPYAKEWVPKECRNNPSPFILHAEKGKTNQSIPKHSPATDNFYEITEKEVEALRSSTCPSASSMKADKEEEKAIILLSFEDQLAGEHKEDSQVQGKTSNKSFYVANDSQSQTSECEGKNEIVCVPACGRDDNASPELRECKEPTSEQCSNHLSDVCLDRKSDTTLQTVASPGINSPHTDTSADLGSDSEVITSPSYACILGRSSPTPAPVLESPKHQKHYEVQQPLPKIFQKDKVPSPEPEVPSLVKETGVAGLFHQPTKAHRTRRKFLQELQKESSCDGSDIGALCVSTSSSIPEISHSPDNPPTLSLSAAGDRQSTPCLSIPPKATSSPQVDLSPRTLSVGGSPGCRVRSSSESSTASLDIEFVEQDEVDRVVQSPRQPSTRGVNSFLSCILGSGNSDSDWDSEDDSDEDWDEVCKEGASPTPDVDDSWETFGLGLVLVEYHVKPHTPPQPQPTSPDTYLKEVNKRWEEGLGRELKPRSAQRVTFGGQHVQPMVAWAHAYRAARRGPWEQEARDRVRFKERVASLEEVIDPVLQPQHRRNVYNRMHGHPTPLSPSPS